MQPILIHLIDSVGNRETLCHEIWEGGVWVVLASSLGCGRRTWSAADNGSK
jgi:hypothetical protein